MSLKLLKDLNFAEKLNSTEAVTEAGKECLKSYRGYMYTNAPSCGIVNGFIQEARRFSFDTGMMSILESVLKFVNENKNKLIKSYIKLKKVEICVKIFA